MPNYRLPSVARRSFIFRYIPLAVLAPITCLVNSCGSSNSDQAQNAVTQFHSALDSEQYHAIYIGSDPGFRNKSSEAEFVAFGQTIHRKLGPVKQSKLTASHLRWFTKNGTMVALFYETQFEGGTAQEEFVWRINNSQPVLFAYYIKSNALLVK